VLPTVKLNGDELVRMPASVNPTAGVDAATTDGRSTGKPLHGLPAWNEVLVVVAHPDDESFGLGALLSSFVTSGSRVSLLCMTHGEASTLHGVDGDLAAVRARELSEAAEALGLARVRLAAYPDGGLPQVDQEVLVAEIADFAADTRPDGIVAFDRGGVTGHPDHQRATEAAIAFASRVGIPVLGWVLPAAVAATLNEESGSVFSGFDPAAIDVRVPVDRTRQRVAIALHRSQALPGQALWRRLELTGNEEHARWQGDSTGLPTPAALHKSGTTGSNTTISTKAATSP
jgi:N-acetylglucosamine malate deacetylase 2